MSSDVPTTTIGGNINLLSNFLTNKLKTKMNETNDTPCPICSCLFFHPYIRNEIQQLNKNYRRFGIPPTFFENFSSKKYLCISFSFFILFSQNNNFVKLPKPNAYEFNLEPLKRVENK